MKVTHAGLFNRAAESYDFASIWAIEDACGRDLDEAMAEYETAKLNTKNAVTEHEKNWAKVAEVQARMNYLAKYAAYVDFFKGY